MHEALDGYGWLKIDSRELFPSILQLHGDFYREFRNCFLMSSEQQLPHHLILHIGHAAVERVLADPVL